MKASAATATSPAEPRVSSSRWSVTRWLITRCRASTLVSIPSPISSSCACDRPPPAFALFRTMCVCADTSTGPRKPYSKLSIKTVFAQASASVGASAAYAAGTEMVATAAAASPAASPSSSPSAAAVSGWRSTPMRSRFIAATTVADMIPSRRPRYSER